jgi:hypothetical protein
MENGKRSSLARLGLAVWVMLVLSVAACMPVMPEGTPMPDTESSPAPTEETMPDNATGADAAGMEIAAQLQQSLANELQVVVSQVEVVSVEAVEWPDACLGVSSPDVMCAQVITPGYLVILSVDEQQYEYHTNSDGTSVQVASAPDAAMEQTAGMEVAAQLQQTLADELQIDADQVEIVSVEAVEWRDACLGVSSPDVMCAQVITPGYLVILAVDGQQYEYHTNSDGTSVQLAAGPETGMGPDELSEDVAFIWYREGGIAGFCDILTAYVTGELEAATCFSDPPQVVGTRPMTAEESEQLSAWQTEYASFEYLHDERDIDDGMTVMLRFAGEGDTVPDGVQQEEIVLTAQDLHATVAQ